MPSPPAAVAVRRTLRLGAGLVLLGTGVALTVQADLGVNPWDVLHQGVAERLGIGMGTVTILVGAVVLAAWIPLRQRPRIGTLANAVVVGLVVDGWLAITGPASAPVVQVALLVLGTGVTALGVGLYISAAFGPGPRDGLMTGIAARGHPVWLVRGGLEAGALATGWLLGGTVGIGTVVFVLAIGPLVHLALELFGPPTDHDGVTPVVEPVG